MLFRKENIVYIYKITNTVNGKIYVGQTKHSIKRRFVQHCNAAIKAKKKIGLYGALLKYGKASFTIEEVLVCADKKTANEFEKYFIKLLNCRSSKVGYNLTDGGDGCTKFGRDNFMYGKKGKLHPSYGRKCSKEQIDNLKAFLTGRKLSPEHVAKLKECHKGFRHSKSAKKKVSENSKKLHAMGIFKTPEYLEKLRSANLFRSKPILCLDNNVVYRSTAEAARQLGVHQGGVSLSARRNKKFNTTKYNAGGKHFVFANTKEQESL